MPFIPFRTDSPLRRTPYANWGLIAANFVVYGVQLSHNPQDAGDSEFVQRLMLQPADPHLWQYITYAFLHANLMHIFGNMLFLYIFGNNINDRMGNIGYTAFYLAGAVVAGIGYVIFDRAGPVLGASGAVAAVTGAYLILLPQSNISVFVFFFFFGVFEIPSLWFILIFFLLDVLGEAAPQLMGGEAAVAHMAHISGTLFGAALCTTLLATRLLPRDQFDVVALAQRWNRRRVYRDVVAGGYDPFGYGPARRARGDRTPPPPPDAATQRILDLRAQISTAASDHNLAAATDLYQQLIGLDPNQVMSRGAQMDLANYMASQHQYPQAAAAYEQLLRFYPTYEQIEQVDLILGMIYGRYLNQNEKAKECLRRAIPRLHFSRELEMARAELAHLEAPGI